MLYHKEYGVNVGESNSNQLLGVKFVPPSVLVWFHSVQFKSSLTRVIY